jgi:hypothetical protein
MAAWCGHRFPKENEMPRNFCRRHVTTVLTLVAVAFGVPAPAFAGPTKIDGIKMEVKPAKERGPKDKITTTCVEGTADYNIDQCYKDIKDK